MLSQPVLMVLDVKEIDKDARVDNINFVKLVRLQLFSLRRIV